MSLLSETDLTRINLMSDEKRRLTLGDRFAAAFVMFFAAGLTALILWLFSVFLATRMTSGEEVISPAFILYFTSTFMIFGFLAPNKSIDVLSWIWSKVVGYFK